MVSGTVADSEQVIKKRPRGRPPLKKKGHGNASKAIPSRKYSINTDRSPLSNDDNDSDYNGSSPRPKDKPPGKKRGPKGKRKISDISPRSTGSDISPRSSSLYLSASARRSRRQKNIDFTRDLIVILPDDDPIKLLGLADEEEFREYQECMLESVPFYSDNEDDDHHVPEGGRSRQNSSASLGDTYVGFFGASAEKSLSANPLEIVSSPTNVVANQLVGTTNTGTSAPSKDKNGSLVKTLSINTAVIEDDTSVHNAAAEVFTPLVTDRKSTLAFLYPDTYAPVPASPRPESSDFSSSLASTKKKGKSDGVVLKPSEEEVNDAETSTLLQIYEENRLVGGYQEVMQATKLSSFHDVYADYDADSEDEQFLKSIRREIHVDGGVSFCSSSTTTTTAASCLPSLVLPVSSSPPSSSAMKLSVISATAAASHTFTAATAPLNLRMFELMISLLERELQLVKTARSTAEDSQKILKSCEDTLHSSNRTNLLISKFLKEDNHKCLEKLYIEFANDKELNNAQNGMKVVGDDEAGLAALTESGGLGGPFRQVMPPPPVRTSNVGRPPKKRKIDPGNGATGPGRQPLPTLSIMKQPEKEKKLPTERNPLFNISELSDMITEERAIVLLSALFEKHTSTLGSAHSFSSSSFSLSSSKAVKEKGKLATIKEGREGVSPPNATTTTDAAAKETVKKDKASLKKKEDKAAAAKDGGSCGCIANETVKLEKVEGVASSPIASPSPQLLSKVYEYWKHKRSHCRSSFLRCYHIFMMDLWEGDSHLCPPIVGDYNIESIKGTYAQLLHIRSDLDRARLVTDRVRRREKLKRDIVRATGEELDIFIKEATRKWMPESTVNGAVNRATLNGKKSTASTSTAAPILTEEQNFTYTYNMVDEQRHQQYLAAKQAGEWIIGAETEDSVASFIYNHDSDNESTYSYLSECPELDLEFLPSPRKTVQHTSAAASVVALGSSSGDCSSSYSSSSSGSGKQTVARGKDEGQPVDLGSKSDATTVDQDDGPGRNRQRDPPSAATSSRKRSGSISSTRSHSSSHSAKSSRGSIPSITSDRLTRSGRSRSSMGAGAAKDKDSSRTTRSGKSIASVPSIEEDVNKSKSGGGAGAGDRDDEECSRGSSLDDHDDYELEDREGGGKVHSNSGLTQANLANVAKDNLVTRIKDGSAVPSVTTQSFCSARGSTKFSAADFPEVASSTGTGTGGSRSSLPPSAKRVAIAKGQVSSSSSDSFPSDTCSNSGCCDTNGGGGSSSDSISSSSSSSSGDEGDNNRSSGNSSSSSSSGGSGGDSNAGASGSYGQASRYHVPDCSLRNLPTPSPTAATLLSAGSASPPPSPTRPVSPEHGSANHITTRSVRSVS